MGTVATILRVAERAVAPMRRALVPMMVPLLLAAVLLSCGLAPTPQPSSSTVVRSTQTPERPRFSQMVGESATQLLETLPEVAGGQMFDHLQVVNDAFHVGHFVDDVLEALQKERRDAVAVFRGSETAMIGATTVQGVDGAALLEAFVLTWHAPANLERLQRAVAGSPAWELRARLGVRTVIYRLGNVIYLVETDDPALLEAILLDMPPNGV